MNGIYDLLDELPQKPATEHTLKMASITTDDEESSRLPAIIGGRADTAEWQGTIRRVVPSVVSICFCLAHAFDTEPALTSVATGFVVDAQKGWDFSIAIGAQIH